MTASQAIERSISHNEIVTLSDPHRSVCHELEDRTEDGGMVDTGSTVEYWGIEDGREWRVHVELVDEDEEDRGDTEMTQTTIQNENNDTLKLDVNAHGYHLIDPAGGVWWPSETIDEDTDHEDALAKIQSAYRANRGRWHC